MGTKLRPDWDQTSTKWRSFGEPLGSLGASLELPGTTLGVPQGSPAPVRHRWGTGDPKKNSKCVTVVKNSLGENHGGTLRYQILGPPRGLSKIAH